ncbi:MAG TPA: hypothetical protein VN327_14515 [Pseudonocardiaceae bacterium]|nr:hypothetical protein [Pseudonocardiaceae bacterium]
MPIRTHRGRAAVYRKFWGWPVRSPKHLAATVLALVVIVIGAQRALPESRVSAVPAVPSKSPQASSLAPAPSSVLPEAGIGRRPRAASPSIPAPAAALTVARSWAQAFLTVPKGITPARWVEQLRPYTTDDLFPQLQSIDPANVPVAQIIEAPRTVSAGAGSAEVDVPTTVVVLRLLLVSTPAGWRVASYERAG